MRSWNRQIPKEIRLVPTGHACDPLLAPTELARANLQAEGLIERSHLVGDVMADLLVNCREERDPRPIRDSLGLEGDYVVAMVHCASNTDDPEQLARLIESKAGIALPVVLVAHLRLVAAAQHWGTELTAGAIRVVEPLDYVSILGLLVGT